MKLASQPILTFWVYHNLLWIEPKTVITGQLLTMFSPKKKNTSFGALLMQSTTIPNKCQPIKTKSDVTAGATNLLALYFHPLCDPRPNQIFVIKPKQRVTSRPEQPFCWLCTFFLHLVYEFQQKTKISPALSFFFSIHTVSQQSTVIRTIVHMYCEITDCRLW